ncbi:MAG: amino acid adenylation domain-containing protein, partial [Terriglobales bacterium]
MLPQLFAAAARRHPGRVALEAPPGIAGGDRVAVTYRELDRQAAAIAAQLRDLALPDAIVAVLLPRHAPALYAAQLGILRAGAAFTCLDPGFPDAHLASVLRDAVAVVTDAAGRARLAGLDAAIPIVSAEAEAPAPASAPGTAIAPSQLAYVIYTSGTTGQPKGVMVEHRSIANLVEANREYFRLGCEARVAQCSSPAYDSSIEETWLALAAGATLVLLDDATVRLGPELIPWLRQERISVFCPPPTLLRSTGCGHPERELPELKLLYVGGEALPQDLADRWARGRWLENGYGPTECTVTATRARIRPGEPVTIGYPVANCRTWVLDGGLEEVNGGEAGELCLGGACLARGYRGQEALTRERFVEHPRLGRLYRTGDLARRAANGNLEYLGRMDAQVKLRGYRVELEAVEAALAACAGVRAAACQIEDGVLGAHLVPANGDRPASDALKRELRRTLPEYMIPSRFGYLETLPVTSAGKLDRARLPPAPRSAAAGGQARSTLTARTPAERAVAAAFAAALKLEDAIPLDEDFFLDLGGDSLSAVEAIVRLRAAGWSASVRSLYQARTAAALAAVAEAAAAPLEPGPGEEPAPPARPGARPAVCTAAQAAWLGLECIVAGALAYAIGFGLLPRLFDLLPLWQAALASFGLTLAGAALYFPLSVGWTALLKRALIGRYQLAREPVWSGFYLRHWIVTHSARHIPWGWVQGTELQAWALRALGAQVGARVYIHRGVDLARGGWDLLALGDGATLGQDAALRLTDLDAGDLVVGPVRVGDGATLDTRAGMDAGSTLGPGAYLGPLSWLPPGASVPAGERWDGAPAEHSGPAPQLGPVGAPGALSSGWHTALALAGNHGSLLLSWLPWLVAAAALPANATSGIAAWLQAPSFSATGLIAAAALVALGVAFMLALEAVATRVFGAVPAGVYSQWSWTAIRIQAAGARVETAGLWLAGTLLWPVWLRAAGMRVGRGCEISTIFDVLPSSVSLGARSFLADGIYLAGPRRHGGVVTVVPTRLGEGTFLGNHAVIPAGFDWPRGLFVGVAT